MLSMHLGNTSVRVVAVQHLQPAHINGNATPANTEPQNEMSTNIKGKFKGFKQIHIEKSNNVTKGDTRAKVVLRTRVWLASATEPAKLGVILYRHLSEVSHSLSYH